MPTVFFSYSHADEALCNELQKQLIMLERSGAIESWHDRCLKAGEEFGPTIDAELERADIILLLVSPDFLASHYCYDIEMKRAMERHEEGSARVIPVILRPCDWPSAPFGKLIGIPTNGIAVTLWPNQDSAFLDVAQHIRNSLAKKQTSTPNVTPLGNNSPTTPSDSPTHLESPRSSNLSIPQSFTQADQDRFLDESFEYIQLFFQNSLAELEKRNPAIESRFKAIDATSFHAEIYRDGKSISQAYIRHGENRFFGGITYGTSPDGNSMNESLNVQVGEQSLSLKPMMGMSQMFSNITPSSSYSQQGAAEYFWSILISPLQR